jgi:hypothetical protein
MVAALKEYLVRLVEDIERHMTTCAAVAQRTESEVAAVREEVHSAIRSLKETEARGDQGVGLRRLSGSPDGIVCVGTDDLSAF